MIQLMEENIEKAAIHFFLSSVQYKFPQHNSEDNSLNFDHA